MSDVLSTSGINSMVSSYMNSESNRLITPLDTRKTKLTTLSTNYGNLSAKLDTLKSVLSKLKATSTSSAFKAKTATSSNSSFVTATATTSASNSAYSLRVNQLAKSDIVLSKDMATSTANTLDGTHSITIKAGDGTGGEFTSTVDVTFDASDPEQTNEAVMEKIRDAINKDKAVVTSGTKTASSTYSGGAGSFDIDLNGTTYNIAYTGGGTYSDLMTEVANKINNTLTGVSAVKVSNSPNPGDVSLKLTVNDTSKYISISHSSGNDIVSDLGIGVTKEKGASGLVTASVFAPGTATSQFSLTAKETGLDYRITQLSDSGSGTALDFLGLNLGSSRPAFDQNQDPDTPGFMYTDITTANNQLNAKVIFNGLDVQRNSNNISDLATGVSFGLKSVMQSTDSTVNVSIDPDVTTITADIQSFIEKFNDVYSYIKTNSQTIDNVRGTFIGDTNASSILSALSTVGYTATGISADNLRALTQIGITFDSTNGLTLSDNSALEDSLKYNASQVESLFNSENGFASTLYNKINPYLGSTGYLSHSIQLTDQTVKDYTDKISAAQDQINSRASSLRYRYQQLLSQLASLMTNSSFFMSSDTSNLFQ